MGWIILRLDGTPASDAGAVTRSAEAQYRNFPVGSDFVK